MSTQTGRQMHCRETGKMKNCGSWAEYEEGHGGSAAMCNGGIYDGDSYDPCPSQPECRNVTFRELEAQRRHLPIVQRSGTQIVGATPAAQQQAQRSESWRDTYARYANSPTTMPMRNGMAPARPSAVQPNQPGTVQYQGGAPYPIHVPTPVQPPAQFPQAMQTPFAAPVPFHMGGVSPTFIPDGDEGIFERLAKNVGQGMIASAGWHVFDFSRNVDMFGRRRR